MWGILRKPSKSAQSPSQNMGDFEEADQLIWPLFFWHIYCQEGIPTDNGNSNQDTNFNTDKRKIGKHLWNVGT